MKNYLIGFTIVLISIFSFCTSVSASEAITVEYSSSKTFTFYSPEYYGFKYGFLFYNNKTSYYYLSNEPLGINADGSISIVSYYDDHVSTGFSFSYVSNVSLSSELSDFRTKTGNVALDIAYTMIWSNYDVPEVANKLSTGNIYHYSDVAPSSNIIITSSDANDLDDIPIKVIKIDFAEVYEDSYTYQYKTSYGNWVDITDYINESASSGYYNYLFNLYYNTTVDVRVLNGTDIVKSNSLVISDLSDYNSNYIYRTSFSSSSINDLGAIDLYVNFNDLMTPYNFRLEYYGNDLQSSNTPFFVTYIGYLLDVNGIKLDYDFNEYFEINYDEYKLFEEDYTTYLDGTITQIKEFPSDVYGYKLSFQFDNLSNYTFNVYDNFLKNSTWDYTLNYLLEYLKIQFPLNFDVAIIRSKNFIDLNSNIVIPNINLVNSKYRYLLYYYDFINNDGKNLLELEKIDSENYVIDVIIDETNNVFPMIYKDSSEENLYFYIKNDCYVQFLNSDSLDSYIIGIEEDIYNENNDLEVNNGLSNFIDINLSKDNEGFFKAFLNSFDYFKESVVTIMEDITFFWDGLSTVLKYFYIVIFSMILFGFLIRFIL